MTKRWMLAGIAAWAGAMAATPIGAQSTFPTRASGVRVGGSVLMICDANASNCAPAGASNALPVTAMGGGPTSSVTSQSVVPATDSPPFPVAGNVASGSADTGAPVKIAGTDGANVRTARTDIAGRFMIRVVDGNGSDITSGIAANDGTTTVVSALQVGSFNRVFNGSTWDRARGDASGAFIGANQFWSETTTALAASGTFSGTLRANGGAAGGVGSRFAFFIGEAFSDVAGGTLYVDKTVDGGATWRQVGSIALVANSSVTLKVPVSAAGYRVRVVNGSTAQAATLVTTAYSLN